jgi:hypothetical protein
LRRIPRHEPLRYLSDLSIDTDQGKLVFLTTQYAVAPHLLVLTDAAAPANWAVGSFSRSDADFAGAAAQAGFTLAENLGSGVALFRRTRP